MKNICTICGKGFAQRLIKPKAGRYPRFSERKTCSKKCFAKKQSQDKFIGEKIGYDGIHMRLYRMFGKAKSCSKCGKGKNFEWANTNGDYTHVKNFVSMCISCHRKFDFQRRKSNPTKKI